MENHEKTKIFLEEIKRYIDKKSGAFNEVDACLFLNRTLNVEIWTHPEDPITPILSREVHSVYGRNAETVAMLLEVGQVEVLEELSQTNHTFKLLIDLKNISSDYPSPMYLIEKSIYGKDRRVIKDKIITLSEVKIWFLDYLNKYYSK